MSNMILIFDTIYKMLQNNEPHKKIISFMDSTLFEVRIENIKKEIMSCQKCKLHECRHTPFTGNIRSDIIFVGEAPGTQEEKEGEPFVGPAGQLFNKMLASAEKNIHPRWKRENVYITNVVKCIPRNNTESNRFTRQPEIEEIAKCKEILDKEIELIKPKIVVCVGAVAANTLIHPTFKISQEHGKLFGDEMKFVAIYHPSYILRRGEDTDEGIELKTEIWEDLIVINKYLEENV